MFCFHILVYIDQLVAAGAKSYLFSPFHDMGAVLRLYAVKERFGVVVLVVMDAGHNIVAVLVACVQPAQFFVFRKAGGVDICLAGSIGIFQI